MQWIGYKVWSKNREYLQSLDEKETTLRNKRNCSEIDLSFTFLVSVGIRTELLRYKH